MSRGGKPLVGSFLIRTLGRGIPGDLAREKEPVGAKASGWDPLKEGTEVQRGEDGGTHAEGGREGADKGFRATDRCLVFTQHAPHPQRAQKAKSE